MFETEKRDEEIILSERSVIKLCYTLTYIFRLFICPGKLKDTHAMFHSSRIDLRTP